MGKKECVHSVKRGTYMYFDSFTSSREIPPEKRQIKQLKGLSEIKLTFALRGFLEGPHRKENLTINCL